MFAATYPEKTAALIAIGSYARRLVDSGLSVGRRRAKSARASAPLSSSNGAARSASKSVRPVRPTIPSFATGGRRTCAWAPVPALPSRSTRMNAEIDVRDVLPSIQVPTLVLHRTGDRCLKVEEGRYLASKIPTATLRRAARRRPLAVCRRSGRHPGRDRAVPVATRRRLPHAEHVLATVLTVMVGRPRRRSRPSAARVRARGGGASRAADDGGDAGWSRRSTAPAAPSAAAAR